MNLGKFTSDFIGLYTPINYFGRYATCSHKDGGRSHIQSRKTIGQENHVTCLKLRPRVNSNPAFLSDLQDAYFLWIRRLQTPLFSFTKFLRSSNTLPSVWINRSEKQQHRWASQTFIYIDYETFSSLRETARF